MTDLNIEKGNSTELKACLGIMAELGLSTSCKYFGVVNKKGWGNAKVHKYNVIVKDKNGQTVWAVPYYAGTGHNWYDVKLDGVLWCLYNDYVSYDNTGSYLDFCDDFGYDNEDEETFYLYSALKRNADKFENLFHNHLDYFHEIFLDY